MTRSIEAQGTTLEDAMIGALADLLACDEEEVDVRVDAPGLDDLTGRIRLDLDIEGDAEDRDGPDDDRDTDDTEDHDGPDDDRDADDADDAEDDRDADGGGRDERPASRAPETDEAELTEADLDEEADAAADFLEGLLDALDLPGDLRIRIDGEYAEVEVVEIGSGALIGRRGQTLEAIQELVRCALQRQFQRRARVKVDAEGYRARRLEKLLEKAEEAIDDVLDTGDAERLEPMDVFERKAIHHLVAEVDGVSSRSQGREPARRVIIEPE